MTPKESFRLGFLLRCAEEGCDVDEIRGRVKLAAAQKQANLPAVVKSLAGAGDYLWDKGRAFVNPAMRLVSGFEMLPIHATALGLAGSAVVGAGGGYGLAKFQEGNVDADEVKRQELIAAYRMQADAARRRAARRSYREPAPRAPRLFDH